MRNEHSKFIDGKLLALSITAGYLGIDPFILPWIVDYRFH